MGAHSFILQPGDWIGDGIITLNMVEEELKFLTKWRIVASDFTGKIQSLQEIQINGITEQMKNELLFFDFTSKSFFVEMENFNVGKVVGSGIYDDKIIAWEFKNNDFNFEGFEIYRLQKDGSYLVHSEYITSDQFRTQIKGHIWPSAEKVEFFDDEEDDKQ